MKTALRAGVAALAIGAAVPAHAQQTKDPARGNERQSECLNKLDQVRQNLQENEQFTSWYRANPGGRGDYIELIQAARVFANANMEQRCMDVVGGMRELADRAGKQQAANQGDRQQKDDQANKADREKSERGERADRKADRQPSDAERARSARDQERVERLKGAQPITQAQVSAERLTGADVRNLNNEDIGDVEDVLMDNGRITAVIVARGGFLGIGESKYMFQADEVKIARGDRADTGEVIAVIDVPEENIEGMQRVELRNGRWVSAEADDANRPGADENRNRTPQNNRQ